MKAVLDRDRIIRTGRSGDTDVGKIPKNIGLERLRWDGTKLVDLMDITEIWVEEQNGSFVLHAVEVPGSQKITMTYRDRKRLIKDGGGIRLRSQAEMDAKASADQALLQDLKDLKADLIQMVKNLDYNKVDTHIESTFGALTTAQKTSLKRLYKVVLFLAKREMNT